MDKKKCISCYRILTLDQFPRGRRKCPQCRASSQFRLQVEKKRNQEFSALMRRWKPVSGSLKHRWNYG